MKLIALCALLVMSYGAQSACPSGLPLKGTVNSGNCSAEDAGCSIGEEALYAYMSARKDDDPAVMYVGIHSSPWHFYDRDFRILEVAELAAMIKQPGGKVKRVVLLSSWSGVAPDKNSKSMAARLSAALHGMPVKGQDGFVWYAADGKVHTTQQAFTIGLGGPYRVARNKKVMASLAAGWPVYLEDHFAKTQDAKGLLRAGAGADLFLLCPERALAAYEASAALADPVAAYNAALMLLERGATGDSAAAMALLEKSAGLGDGKAQTKLASLRAAEPR